ncbi:single-stranded-DNA-specific exonuclease RecJ [Thiomonas sp.]
MELNVRPVDRSAVTRLIGAGHPRALARVYAGRGIMDEAQLQYRAAQAAPANLKGMTEAVRLLLQAIRDDARILVVADYDCDGATACAVMVRGLRSLGARQVDFLVPNRFTDGYGLTPPITRKVVERGADILITVDNGISSIAGVAAAKAAGLRVIVTDHHLAGPELPEADAILNPNQPDCPFPWKSTAGVGVAFYLILALYRQLQEDGIPDLRNPAWLTPLVALGTVADVVPLEYNNRLLVSQGLSRWREGHAPAGLLALAKVSRCELETLSAQHIGFQLGPRLNAAGRMDGMTIGIRCLLSDDPDEALRLAEELDAFNKQRRVVEKEQCLDALAILGSVPTGASGLTARLPDGHVGVIGIVAGRLREQFNRPVIVFAKDGDLLKGSGRSIPGFHLRDALADMATEHPEWFRSFGGHAMAAGMAIPDEYYEAFAQRFDQLAQERIPAEALLERLETDGILGPGEITLSLAEAVEQAGIWGQQFPEPVFMGSFDVLDRSEMKGGHLKFLLGLDNGEEVEAVLFGGGVDARQGQRLQVAYALGINDFRGRRLQLRLLWAEVPADS